MPPSQPLENAMLDHVQAHLAAALTQRRPAPNLRPGCARDALGRAALALALVATLFGVLERQASATRQDLRIAVHEGMERR